MTTPFDNSICVNVQGPPDRIGTTSSPVTFSWDEFAGASYYGYALAENATGWQVVSQVAAFTTTTDRAATFALSPVQTAGGWYTFQRFAFDAADKWIASVVFADTDGFPQRYVCFAISE